MHNSYWILVVRMLVDMNLFSSTWSVNFRWIMLYHGLSVDNKMRIASYYPAASLRNHGYKNDTDKAKIMKT